MSESNEPTQVLCLTGGDIAEENGALRITFQWTGPNLSQSDEIRLIVTIGDVEIGHIRANGETHRTYFYRSGDAHDTDIPGVEPTYQRALKTNDHILTIRVPGVPELKPGSPIDWQLKINGHETCLGTDIWR